MLPNIPEFPIAFLGAAGAGITITTANPTYRYIQLCQEIFLLLPIVCGAHKLKPMIDYQCRAEEVARQFELSGAKFVVTLAMFLPNVKQVENVRFFYTFFSP